MNRKYVKEAIGCMMISVVIVLLLLGMVAVFEYLEIHVPGSREMWIGLIGAVLGGAFTLIGVRITLYHQKESNEENRRLEYMPILGFEAIMSETDPELILTITEEGVITSGFFCLKQKICSQIEIKTINHNCVFDFQIEGCAVNGKKIASGSAFYPAKRRLTDKEATSIVFDYDINTNVFCLLRISYKDVFGASYYQDLPFTYAETIYDGEDRVRQIVELRDVKAPTLQKDAKDLEEAVKDYLDYKVFCEASSYIS